MDFRPTRKALIINYAATFGVVGGVCLLGLQKPAGTFYSPEYNANSHVYAGYASQDGEMHGCRECHATPFAKWTDATCSTADCHFHFDTAKGPATAADLALTKDEFKKDNKNYGATLAFHRRLGDKMACDTCHPSHRMPQTGLFNGTKMAGDAEARIIGLSMVERAKTSMKTARADAFHEGAKAFEKITGAMSCADCHVGPAAAGTSPTKPPAAAPAASAWMLPTAPDRS